ncbi:MAG TPA: glycerophosphodiester phosphodiesterase [Nocardioidaceae bacterium]|nr:glycerophosphodiester phosphodiesterase [Nocardioidaceae bacterium]
MTRPITGFPYLDEPEGVIAFAHRGGARHPEIPGIENTLAAFEHAASLGYAYLETDVHATSDGVLLAFHDDVLDRVTDRRGVIYEQPYVDVAAARIRGVHPIPKLEELMEQFPEHRFNIDIKSRGAIDPLATLIERRGAYHRVCVGSFDEGVIRTFRRRIARPVATACGPVAVVATRSGAPVRGLFRDAGVAFQVPHRTRGVDVVTSHFVRRAHAAGRHVHVWTIDDPEEMRDLLDLGVDGLITDRTDLLREVLIERGQWPTTGRGSAA